MLNYRYTLIKVDIETDTRKMFREIFLYLSFFSFKNSYDYCFKRDLFKKSLKFIK